MIDIKFISKKDNTGFLYPFCADCGIALIYSKFENGIGRYLCPECKGVGYIDEEKVTPVRGYSIYE